MAQGLFDGSERSPPSSRGTSTRWMRAAARARLGDAALTCVWRWDAAGATVTGWGRTTKVWPRRPCTTSVVPTAHVPPPPIGGLAGWTAAELENDPVSWRADLTTEDVDEIDRALVSAEQSGRPMSAWTQNDFALPGLSARFAEWRLGLMQGRGVRVLRGVPVQRWSRAQAERFFWGLGLNLGTPGAQNPQGDLLGHVTDLQEDGEVRLYRTSGPIRFHCDAADVVGLLCLRSAKEGGRSRIASSVAIFNELARTHPALVGRLFEPFAMDAYGGAGLQWFSVTPCRYFDGVLRTFYHSDYLRSAERHRDAPRLTNEDRVLLDAYDALANDPRFCVEMDFLPGDIQLLSNHFVVHARSGYVDHPEPDRRRHLLRLWLSVDVPMSGAAKARKGLSYLGLVGHLARQKMRARWSA